MKKLFSSLYYLGLIAAAISVAALVSGYRPKALKWTQERIVYAPVEELEMNTLVLLDEAAKAAKSGHPYPSEFTQKLNVFRVELLELADEAHDGKPADWLPLMRVRLDCLAAEALEIRAAREL